MITITKESDDKLSRETWGLSLQWTWGFNPHEPKIAISLSYYKLEQRRTVKCKYRIRRRYDYGCGGYPESIKKDLVPWSDEIVEAVRADVIKRLIITK